MSERIWQAARLLSLYRDWQEVARHYAHLPAHTGFGQPELSIPLDKSRWFQGFLPTSSHSNTIALALACRPYRRPYRELLLPMTTDKTHTPATDSTQWPEQVLTFWFEELDEKDWFGSSEQLDATIKQRFGDVHRELSAYSALPEPLTPEHALAAVIVLDQFSRNMFRGTSDAFKYDALALTFTKQAMRDQLQDKLDDKQKWFLFMPFMHSENLSDQKAALDLFTGKSAESAVEHHDIIARFGRFPHRNEVLGRENTPEETQYLKNARRFGQ